MKLSDVSKANSQQGIVYYDRALVVKCKAERTPNSHTLDNAEERYLGLSKCYITLHTKTNLVSLKAAV